MKLLPPPVRSVGTMTTANRSAVPSIADLKLQGYTLQPVYNKVTAKDVYIVWVRMGSDLCRTVVAEAPTAMGAWAALRRKLASGPAVAI